MRIRPFHFLNPLVLAFVTSSSGLAETEPLTRVATELANPAIGGPNATPANDGLSNLIKYALGLPPKTPSTNGITLTKPSGNWLFTYTRPANRTDLSYSVEISPNLQSNSWTISGVAHQLLTPGDPQTWQATASSGTSLFLRLKITLP